MFCVFILEYADLRKMWNYSSIQFFPHFRKSVAFFWKALRLRPFFIAVRAECRWRRVWSIGGILLTGEGKRCRITGQWTGPSATLSCRNLMWTDMEPNTDLRSERSASDRLSHGTAVNYEIRWNIIKGIPFLPQREHSALCFAMYHLHFLGSK
jgi:hypothetical protein